MQAIELFPYRNEFRERLFPALRMLTPEQLAYKPPGSRNAIGGYLRHVAQSEDWFVHQVLLRGSFQPKRSSDLPGVEEIIAYLHWTRGETERLLRETPAEGLRERRPIPAEGLRGSPRPDADLLWIFQRIFWHETYHSAQCLLVMRLQGLEPPVI